MSATSDPAASRPADLAGHQATRRDLAAIATAAALAPALPITPAGAQGVPRDGETPVLLPLSLRVNGQAHALEVDTRLSLLELLRDELGLTGSKPGCLHGQCGACTVLLNGRRVNSCLALAVTLDGAEVVTVEGLAASDGTLHPVQAAFVAHDGLQCGYCTPGQICSAIGALAEARAGWPSAATADIRTSPGLDAAEIRERLSGNICRCGAYPNIVAAVEEAAADPAASLPARVEGHA